MMLCRRLLLLVVVLVVCVCSSEGRRPELVGSSAWYTNQSLFNENFEVIVVQMDFDQPLYTNGHSFHCPGSEKACDALTCRPCDWSGQEPSGCGESDCCGPAQKGDMESASAWCDSEGPMYETLTIGETSRRFSLSQGEKMYVRFYIPEEYYCRSFQFIPRSYYGSISTSFSTLDAYPTFSTNSGWRNGQNRKELRYGQSSSIFCPNTDIHPEYNAGTYSGMLYAVVDTSFEIELLVSPEENPVEPPEEKLCGDVPSELLGLPLNEEGSICLEEGVTEVFDPAIYGDNQAGMVIPIEEGCKTLSISLASEIPTSSTQSSFFYCMPPVTTRPAGADNVGLYQTATNGQTLIVSACFDDLTFLRCSLKFLTPEPIHVSFSTNAPVIRKPITEIPDASLAYMDGLQAARSIKFGGPLAYPKCADFYAVCSDWMVTPSENPLYLYPPPASPNQNAERIFEDLQEFYRNAGLQTIKENRLTFVLTLQMGSTALSDKNLTATSIAITSITNEDGEPVSLPGGGLDTNPDSSKQYSPSNWVSNIGILDIPQFQLPDCDINDYQRYQSVIGERLRLIASDASFSEVLGEKYSLDTMNAAVLAQSCSQQVTYNLDTFEEDTFVTDSVDCNIDRSDLSYWGDVCCNILIQLLDCCLPHVANLTETYFGTSADVSECGEERCAQTYYEELSFSLNNVQDADLGCTTGITDPASELGQAMSESLKSLYNDCLTQVGFGDLYQGIDCQTDSECDNYLGICHKNKCALPPLDELEKQFLECYIESMPSSLEFYIRRNVLPPFSDYPKNSPKFYEDLLEAATVMDCVNPKNPLEIDFRTRYQGRPLDYACVAENLYGLSWPEDAVEVVELCPGQPCLRSFGCLLNSSSCIFEPCQEYSQDYIEATEETCPTSEDCDIDIDGDCSGNFCVYCPPNGDLPCTEVPSLSNEADCMNGIACELPDGTVRFDLTEEECRNQGEGCTTDCPGNSCESIYLLPGGCFVPSLSSESDCSLYSSENDVETNWFKDSLCVLPSISSSDECAGYLLTEWETCQENELSDCTGGTTQQQFLGCYESLWHECASQEECEDPENGGRCTDRDILVSIHSYDPVDIQYGACINSGEYESGVSPLCDSVNEFYSIAGCVSKTIQEPDDCLPVLFKRFAWATISLSKEECIARAEPETNRGCQISFDPLDQMLWIFGEEECNCKGGEVQNAWEWIPGVWKGGVPRSLEWREAESHSSYEYKNSLSFIMLAEWILLSTEKQFLYPLQSQIICESQSISLPVSTLVCDCLGDGGEECYETGEQQKELIMGLSEVCEGETNFVKTPSAQVNFGTKSVSSGCTFLNVSIVYKNWFSAPFIPPPLSFKWENPKERGIVINNNGATVGEVAGDGLVLTFFTEYQVVEKFDVCLRISVNGSNYDVPDFGFSDEKLENIFSLGVIIDVQDRDNDGVWYCSSFDFKGSSANQEGTLRLFPIRRTKNYQEEGDNYVSDTTKSFCYTLGALYSLFGVLSLFGMILLIWQAFSSKKSLWNLPAFCSSCFVVLCVFRASFMFLYPTGTFEFEPLAYFVVFEIPTFILFSLLIYMIYSFKRLVYKKGFFPGNPTPILVIGWTFVWGLWVVVTIIYSEVILDGNGGESACEGRVEVSYGDEEEDTRTLSIAYQSIIIVITFVLTCIFFFYTYQIYTNSKNKTNRAKQFIIIVGGSFNVCFFIRSVLFLIILAADFASSVYLFCTLFITEILMMTFLLIQFNLRYLHRFSSYGSSEKTTNSTTNRSRSATERRTPPPRMEM